MSADERVFWDECFPRLRYDAGQHRDRGGVRGHVRLEETTCDEDAGRYHCPQAQPGVTKGVTKGVAACTNEG
jgi:hypothetical protein